MSPTTLLASSLPTLDALWAQRDFNPDLQGSQAAVAGMCCGLVIVIPIALAIGAAILMGACAICRVPQPDFLPAMGIVLATGLCVGVATFIVNFAMGLLLGGALAAGGGGGGGGQGMPMAAMGFHLLTIPVNLTLSALISAGLYSAMLRDCTFGKGLLIWLVELLIKFVIAVVIVGALFVIIFVTGAAHR